MSLTLLIAFYFLLLVSKTFLCLSTSNHMGIFQLHLIANFTKGNILDARDKDLNMLLKNILFNVDDIWSYLLPTLWKTIS